MTTSRSRAKTQKTPAASSEAALKRMKGQRLRDTAPEVALRDALAKAGHKFEVEQKVLNAVRRRADIVFPEARVVVLIDGCFWHACPVHATWPKANAEWWKAKIEGNQRRDGDTNRMLAEAGYAVVRVWEHEPIDSACARVAGLVKRRLDGDLVGGSVHLGV